MSKEDIYDKINKRLQPSQKLQGSEIQPARNKCRVRGQNLKCLIHSLAARPVFSPSDLADGKGSVRPVLSLLVLASCHCEISATISKD